MNGLSLKCESEAIGVRIIVVSIGCLCKHSGCKGDEREGEETVY